MRSAPGGWSGSGCTCTTWLGGRMTLKRSRGLRKSRHRLYRAAQERRARLRLFRRVRRTIPGLPCSTPWTRITPTARRSLSEPNSSPHAAMARCGARRCRTDATSPCARWSTPLAPGSSELLGRLGINASAGVRLVKGSHIVVPRAVRRRSRLYPPARRPPHRLRDPLSGPDRDRHDRRSRSIVPRTR